MTHPSIEDIPLSELDDYLEHYGVKGMKWGVRKAASTRRDIKDARARQRIRKGEIRQLQSKSVSETSSTGKAAAEKALKKAMSDFENNPDYKTSKKFTALEQVGVGLVSGVALPVVGGIAVAGGMAVRNRQLNKQIERDKTGG